MLLATSPAPPVSGVPLKSLWLPPSPVRRRAQGAEHAPCVAGAGASHGAAEAGTSASKFALGLITVAASCCPCPAQPAQSSVPAASVSPVGPCPCKCLPFARRCCGRRLCGTCLRGGVLHWSGAAGWFRACTQSNTRRPSRPDPDGRLKWGRARAVSRRCDCRYVLQAQHLYQGPAARYQSIHPGPPYPRACTRSGGSAWYSAVRQSDQGHCG